MTGSRRGLSITGTLRVVDRTGTGVLRGSVELLDASLQNVAAKIAASTNITVPVGSSEAPFRLSLTSEVDPKAQYLIAGRLEGEDLKTGRKRLFGTTVAYPWTSEVRHALIELRPWN